MSLIAIENLLDPRLLGYSKPNPAKPDIDFENIDFESKEPIKSMAAQEMAKPKDKIDFDNLDFETPDEVGVRESAIFTYRPQERGMFGKVWDEILQYSKDTAGENAKSQNAYNMAESLGIGYTEAYDNLSKLSRDVGLRDQPTFQELVEGTIVAGVTAGLIAHPVATVIGVGAFMVLNEIENAAISRMSDRIDYKFGAGVGVADVLPSDTRQEIKDLVWLADMSWKAIAAGRLARKATPGVQQGIQNLYTRFVRDVSESQGFPKSVYISPETFIAFRGKGNERVNTQIEGEVLKHVNLTRDQIKMARDQGIDIEIPADKIITMVDKPWWGAVKKMFRAEPFRRVRTISGIGPDNIVTP
ncbi:MAG: hypothetical protein KKD77_22985, partial [Gammaproteobacteria bacterium]|nr:hypothetical protein [Gammaproteobacteria bacterium]